MRALSGAMIVLSGAVVLAAVIHGNAVCDAAGRTFHSGIQGGTAAGIVLILVGKGLLIAGWRTQRDD